MVLATIIRLEMAYPGIGILAGDNAQYLSIVTAHGVIMVFFMAMPMLFGFFGNFLLPTQLGVHDVAFPRMNSAAFWFLPASLLALCQLVCIDRRYQRMNCFNIRELQGLLRNRFFEETLPTVLLTTNTKQSSSFLLNFFLNKSTSVSTTNEHNLLLQTTNNPSNFWQTSQNFTTSVLTNINPKEKILLNNINHGLFTFIINFWEFFKFNLITFSRYIYKNCIFFFNSTQFSFDKEVLNENWQFFRTNFWFLNFTFVHNFNLFFLTDFIKQFKFTQQNKLKQKPYTNVFKNSTDRLTVNETSTDFQFFQNSWNSFRNLDWYNPEYIYKIKTGNYAPDTLYKTNFSFLTTTLNNKSIAGYKSDWFLSKNINASSFQSTNRYNTLQNIIHHTSFKNVGDFLFFKNENNKLFDHWQKMQNISLFFAQSKQARVLNNWRDLKIHREGWRCRMLSARHQRSLYRRYVNENELIWVVERNAKDLLPGWAMITPFSSRTRYTLVGKTDIGIAIVVVTLIASMISSANFLMTYRYLSTLNNRKMRDARSFFSESVIAASWMMIAANPMLILGLLMLLSDRHWKTSFFDYSGGGDTILFQHMFWFFGHPEVYIIIVPCFGITNTLLSFYLRKRISARASLMYSLYTIAFLGFFVWGHHMYMVGLAHTTRMLYSTLTVMISVPAATKIMHWLVTFVNSAVHFELPLILTLFFVFYFISGGISGMAVAHTGMNIIFHDTFYVIGHFHVMLAGSLMFAGFAAFYFYLPSLFGVRYSRTFAYLHVFYYSLGQIFTVIPMIWLGYLGMPRRVLDYPAALGGWHSLTSSAHMITVSGILAFVIMLFDSLRKQKGYTIKTFGVGRYNTRLNFYLYQIARNRYWISKHLSLIPVNAIQRSKNFKKAHNLEYLESTLFYYTFKQRTFGKTWLYL